MYPAYLIAWMFVRLFQFRVFSVRTSARLHFELFRMRARARSRRMPRTPLERRLHIGAGTVRVAGWLNADIVSDEAPVDLAAPLPWDDVVFEVIVGEHVIEHLDLEQEALPFLRELHRVARPGGEIWLSTPDIEKVCRAYLDTRGASLVASWEARNPGKGSPIGNFPPGHMLNRVFHQFGEHQNLFDFELLRWALTDAGFQDCMRVDEAELLRRFPEFPPRRDDFHSLYVRAVKT
jgi:predicted SAM-dependent methyltransferase